MNNQEQRKREKAMNRAKVKQLSIIERIPLKIAGSIDGVKGLPRCGEGGTWVSPFLDREVKAFDEYSTRMWGLLQVTTEDRYAQLSVLKKQVETDRDELADARLALKELTNSSKPDLSSRKNGEASLTEEQVKSRRSREYQRRIAPAHERVKQLESKLDSSFTAMCNLRSELIEANNSTRLLCERLSNHVEQRILCYWNAALKGHKDEMPILPDIELSWRESEEIYLAPHRNLLVEMERKEEEVKQDVLD